MATPYRTSSEKFIGAAMARLADAAQELARGKARYAEFARIAADEVGPDAAPSKPAYDNSAAAAAADYRESFARYQALADAYGDALVRFDDSAIGIDFYEQWIAIEMEFFGGPVCAGEIE